MQGQKESIRAMDQDCMAVALSEKRLLVVALTTIAVLISTTLMLTSDKSTFFLGSSSLDYSRCAQGVQPLTTAASNEGAAASLTIAGLDKKESGDGLDATLQLRLASLEERLKKEEQEKQALEAESKQLREQVGQLKEKLGACKLSEDSKGDRLSQREEKSAHFAQQLQHGEQPQGDSGNKVNITEVLIRKQLQHRRDEIGCHSFEGEEARDSIWFPWEIGLGYERLTKEQMLDCVARMPTRQIVWMGDSVMRNTFHNLLRILKAPQSHIDELTPVEHLASHHLHEEGGAKIRFVFASEGDTIPIQLQKWPDALNSDVMILNFGVWDMREYSTLKNSYNNTLFMLAYMKKLAAAIELLQDNYKGRVIFSMTCPIARDNIYVRGRWNSKIGAYNRFAKKLVEGAGYETLHLYDFIHTGQGGFIPYRNLTDDGFHPTWALTQTAAYVYMNEICQGRAFGVNTPKEIVKATENFTFKTCKF